MDIRSTLQSLAGALPRKRMRRSGRRFLAATTDCRGTQHAVLRELLRLNGSSEFCQEHGLDRVSDSDAFRHSIGVTDYDLYQPWIEQLKTGHQAAMLGPENPLLMFTLSSGTTADAKFIPVSRRFLDDYRRGWKIWAIFAYDDHRAATGGNIVQFVSQLEQFHTSGGIPCGNISGLAIRMQSNFVVRNMYTIPFDVARIEDPEAKYYASMRSAIADARVGMVTTANPSTLLRVAQFANNHCESLIRDIADGTISADFDIAGDIRASLTRKLQPQRQRAAELDRIVEQTGHLYPRDYWNAMRFLAVWTGGSCAAYMDAVHDCFGNVPARDHGLHASEGRMTIPLQDNSCDGVLDVMSNYYEFIPADEYGTNNPTILEAHQLEAGNDYYILLTTGSGFYRYDICDVVRCTGHYGTTPLLRFLHKGAHISNITGEKLSESQIVESVRFCTDELNLELDQYTAMPVWGEPPGYRLVIEESDSRHTDSWNRLAVRIDQHLQETNIEYRDKRQSGRLTPLELTRIVAGTWSRFTSNRRKDQGGTLEQYKHPCLIPDLESSRAFFRDYVGN
ncbi:MAG: GH3 auxin-responsive promoter family protein [Planctomycetota bacterium]|nr:GH3 auxin-responsive promoter family protein [Planctomycetota bacterium]